MAKRKRRAEISSLLPIASNHHVVVVHMCHQAHPQWTIRQSLVVSPHIVLRRKHRRLWRKRRLSLITTQSAKASSLALSLGTVALNFHIKYHASRVVRSFALAHITHETICASTRWQLQTTTISITYSSHYAILTKTHGIITTAVLSSCPKLPWFTHTYQLSNENFRPRSHPGFRI